MMTTWYEQLSDDHLLERVDSGDMASFEALFQRHYDRVYGLLFRLVGSRAEAEDLVQEVFLQLYQRPPAKRQTNNVSAWLYRVATNLGYNEIRGRKRRWQRDKVLVPDGSDQTADPVAKLESHEAQKRVRRALAQLSKQEGQLLLLRQMGLSYAELAEVCEINPASVGKMLSRAAAKFREVYCG